MKIRTLFTSLPSPIFRLFCSGLLATLFGLVTLLAFPTVASAHAEYVSSDPAANKVLKTAPSTITIHFSEGVDPKSKILVYDTNQQLVSQDAQVDRADLKKMTVAMQPDQSELYVVDWYTVSADDGHQDAGSFRFFVNPSSDLTDAVHSASNTSGTNTTQTNTSSSGGWPVWSAILIGVVGLLIGGLAGVFFGRRRPEKA